MRINSVEFFYLTASGGPLYKTSLKKMDNISISEALKHPNWKMGKKITIDSATMINKVYEVIEAKNIFNISYDKIKILTHPKSYIHAILKFKTGMIKIIAHDTTMKIPIFNTLYSNSDIKFVTKEIDLNILNNLNFKNDVLVELFLKQKIRFTDIHKKLFNIIKSKEFVKYKKLYPSKIEDIINLNNYVRLKIHKKVYKSLNV
jgi:1-deoxy-D-xylulose-5-phosphate reductoisomerase